MKKKWITPLGASLFVAALSLAPANADEPVKTVEVDEAVILLLADEPTGALEHAHESFVKKQYKQAAAELRKGAAFVKLEAARASDTTKERLQASAQELEKLAKSTEAGTIKSAKNLEAALGRAHHALAESHRVQATEAWAKKESQAAGNELKATTEHLKAGLRWSGHKLENADAASLKKAGEVGDKLAAGGSWAAKEVGKCMEFTGKETEKLGQRLEKELE